MRSALKCGIVQLFIILEYENGYLHSTLCYPITTSSSLEHVGQFAQFPLSCLRQQPPPSGDHDSEPRWGSEVG